MKKLLWIAGVVSAVAAVGAATAAVVISARKKQLAVRPRSLVGPVGFTTLELAVGDIFDAEIIEDDIIEIIPLDAMSGPLSIDRETQAMLEQLSDRAMFLK